MYRLGMIITNDRVVTTYLGKLRTPMITEKTVSCYVQLMVVQGRKTMTTCVRVCTG